MQKKLWLLLLPFVAAVILSVAIVGYTTYDNARAMLTEAEEKNFISILADAQRSINADMEKMGELGYILAASQDIRTLLDPRSPEEEKALARLNVQKSLQNIVETSKLSANLLLFDAKGEMLLDRQGSVSLNIAHTSYFQAVMRGETIKGVKRHTVSAIPFLYVAVPIRYRDLSLGGCIVRMDLQTLTQSLITKADKGTDTKLHVLGTDNKIIATSDTSLTQDTSILSTPEIRAVLNSQSTLLPVDKEGRRVAMHSPVHSLDISLLLSADTKLLMAPAAGLLQKTLLNSTATGLVSIFMVYGLLWLVLRRETRSEARLNQVVALAGLPTWEWSGDGQLRVNAYFNKLLGLPTKDCIYSMQWYIDRIHAEDLPGLSRRVPAGTRDSMPYDATFRMRHADGHWHWLRTIGNITQWDINGIPQFGTGIYLDIHASQLLAQHEKAYQKELEASVEEHSRISSASLEALQREKNLLRNVVDNIPDFIYFKDSNLNLLGDNKAFREHFGILGADMEEDTRMRLQAQDTKAFTSGHMLRVEESLRSSLQDMILEVEICKAIVRDDAGTPTGLICIGRDISLRRQAEAAIVNAQMEATAASMAKSDFLANMSHEIRTPLNGIQGLTHLALHQNPPPELRDHLEHIQASAHNLLTLVDDILDFSKLTDDRMPLETTPFALHEAVTSTVASLGPLAEQKGLALTVDIATNAPTHIWGDAVRFQQILYKLINNGIKFTHQGRVSVTVSAATFRDTGQPQEVLICVEDTGIGMDKTHIDDIFQHFTQADTSSTRQYGGVGLGLAITRALVVAMGGQLQVESTLHKGSLFSFTLPLRAKPAALAPDPAQEELPTPQPDTAQSPEARQLEDASHPLQGVRVLLVEDNDINQIVAQEMLENMGCTVSVAVNGKEALLKTEQLNFDAVLMDIQMPIMDGLTATRHLRAKGWTKPIIALTANAMPQDKINALAAGMQDHVSKPVDFMRLEKTLCYWLQVPH